MRRRQRVMLAAVVALATIAVAAPVSASSHEVEIAIVFDGQSCDDGSDKLITQVAADFDVEACFSNADGSPISGREVYLEVTQGDGEVQRGDAVVTDAEGKARFTVKPTSAGSTVATIYDDDGPHGSVELKAEVGPAPPVPPYVPSGNDIGPTAEITDQPLDMIDANRGAEAGPEASSVGGGMDIRSFSYAGIVDGNATFKIKMIGNGRALFERSLSRWDVNVTVTTPEGVEFSAFASNIFTFFDSGVFAGGERLDDKPEVAWADENTLCLIVPGVDVPAGSTVTITTAVAFDEEGSGIYDEARGTLIAADPGETADEGDSGSETESEPGETATTTDDGGGFGLLDLGLIGVLAVLVIATFWGLERLFFRPRRLYRFDRGDAGVFVEDGTEEDDTEIGAGPGVIVDPGTAPPQQDPEEKDCEPERREFESAQEAKDAAFAAGEAADEELADAKAEWGRLDATTTNPLGDKPEPDIDPTASEAEQTRQQRVHELYLQQWQELEDQATDAKGKVDAAKQAMDAARSNSDEAWQDFQRCRRRLEAARVALDNCDGSAPAAEGESDGGEIGGGATGGDSPGIITEPPGTAPETPEPGCGDGDEKRGKRLRKGEFRVLGGDITVEVPTVDWKRAGNVMDAQRFAALETSRVEALSAGIEQRINKARLSVKIPTAILTVKCYEVLVCSGGEWVDSGRTERVETSAPGPLIDVLPVGTAGGRIMSKDKIHAGTMVTEAQTELKALQKNQKAADDFTCD